MSLIPLIFFVNHSKPYIKATLTFPIFDLAKFSNDMRSQFSLWQRRAGTMTKDDSPPRLRSWTLKILITSNSSRKAGSRSDFYDPCSVVSSWNYSCSSHGKLFWKAHRQRQRPTMEPGRCRGSRWLSTGRSTHCLWTSSCGWSRDCYPLLPASTIPRDLWVGSILAPALFQWNSLGSGKPQGRTPEPGFSSHFPIRLYPL